MAKTRNSKTCSHFFYTDQMKKIADYMIPVCRNKISARPTGTKIPSRQGETPGVYFFHLVFVYILS